MEEIALNWEVTPKVSLYRSKIESIELDDVVLAYGQEVQTFKTQKRKDEHLSGRKLLYNALNHWGLDSPDEVEVRRDEYRAPSLAWIHGIWKNHSLPGFSICHSNEYVWVAIVESGWSVGVDVEKADRVIAENALDLMAKGDELKLLQSNPDQTIISWTSKESIQKSMGLGMHFNPRHIVIPSGEGENIISIENSIFQLQNFCFEGQRIAISITNKTRKVRDAEDDLLDATLSAMQESDDWGVGCKTTRLNG